MIEQLWLFHCGFFRAPEKMLTQSGSFRLKKYPFLAMLAVHSEHGPVIIDAPFGHEGPANAGLMMSASLRLLSPPFKSRWSIVERIREIGFRSADVDHVLMTHLHFDHTGGMKELAHAKFSIHEPEWTFGISEKAKLSSGFSKKDYQALDVKTFDLPTGSDIFGDGSIQAIDLRGHTPGQVGYRFNLSNGDTYIHAADAAYSVEQIKGSEGFGSIARIATHYDQAKATLQTLKLMAASEPDVKWITSHDPILGRQCENGPIALIEI